MGLVSAMEVATATCMDHRAIVSMARSGAVPSVPANGARNVHGKTVSVLFEFDAAVAAIRALDIEKLCPKCGRTLPIGEFRTKRNKNGTIGRSSECNDCHKAYNLALRQKEAQEKGMPSRTLVEIREAAEARKAERRAKWDEQRKRMREAKLRRAAEIRTAKTLRCTRCGEEKPRKAFYQSSLKFGQVVCKSCRKEMDRAKYERIKADPEAWERRLNSPARRLRNRIGTQMRNALLNHGLGKDPGVFRYLGYTVDELRRHLERTFSDGMSWDNMHEWHIDHIVPLSAFEFSSVHDQGFRRCWALSNLRACWAKDNLSKGCKRLFLL